MSRWIWITGCVMLGLIASPAFGQDAATAEETAEQLAGESEIEVEVTIHSIDVPGIEKELRIVNFEALSIGRQTKYMIFLPDDYDDTEKVYPVLYLLHGFSQNYTVWPMMGVSEYLDTYNDLIIVMPDVGNSWYINWAESDKEELNNWEDFMIYDLIHNVDQTFRTIPEREGRAISGLSMGGYGALILGLRHPDLFCSIASHSGALGYARTARAGLEAGNPPIRSVAPQPEPNPKDSDVPEMISIPGFTRQHERYPNGVAFNTVEECNQYDPFFLVDNIPPKLLPHIYLDCGIEDNLLSVSQEFAMLMMQKGLPFAFAQSPGEHRPSYWGREVATSLGVQYAVIDRNIQFLARKQAQQLQEMLMDEVNAATTAAGGGEGHEGHEGGGEHNHDNVRAVEIDNTKKP
jgi:putative tributyrin esterase